MVMYSHREKILNICYKKEKMTKRKKKEKRKKRKYFLKLVGGEWPALLAKKNENIIR